MADAPLVSFTPECMGRALADRRVMITNLPEETDGLELFTFLQQAMQFLIIEIGGYTADLLLLEGIHIVIRPEGKKAVVATFKHDVAAIACIHLDQIRYRGEELLIQRPDDYVPPVDGDPVDRVEFDEDGNFMLDGKPLISYFEQAADAPQGGEPPRKRPKTVGSALHVKCGWDKAMGDVLAGTYIPSGTHHSRAVYKRVDPLGDQVFLYYWDERTGERNCGWWFGPEVGGQEAIVQSTIPFPGINSFLPNRRGWRILYTNAIDPAIEVRRPQMRRLRCSMGLTIGLRPKSGKHAMHLLTNVKNSSSYNCMTWIS